MIIFTIVQCLCFPSTCSRAAGTISTGFYSSPTADERPWVPASGHTGNRGAARLDFASRLNSHHLFLLLLIPYNFSCLLLGYVRVKATLFAVKSLGGWDPEPYLRGIFSFLPYSSCTDTQSLIVIDLIVRPMSSSTEPWWICCSVGVTILLHGQKLIVA